MITVNGTQRRKVTAADFGMETVKPDVVLLPYHGELWGGLLYHTLEAVLPFFGDECERGLLYGEAIQDTAVCVLFNIQRRQIRATAYITAQTTRDGLVNTRLPIVTETSEVVSVLDEFFERGGVGLAPNYLENYHEKYKKWRSGAA